MRALSRAWTVYMVVSVYAHMPMQSSHEYDQLLDALHAGDKIIWIGTVVRVVRLCRLFSTWIFGQVSIVFYKQNECSHT